MLANVAVTGLHTRACRSAHATVPKTGLGPMPREAQTSNKGLSAIVRSNTPAAGWVGLAGKEASGVEGRELALLSHPPLPLLSLRKASNIPWGSYPAHVAEVITCIWDRTWTATPSELFGINTQVISRKLFDHDSAHWLES